MFSKKETGNESNDAKEMEDVDDKGDQPSKADAFRESLKMDAPSLEEQAQDAQKRKFEKKSDAGSDSG